MDANWFKSLVANGCFETQVLGGVPDKETVLLHRSRRTAGELRLYKVCGSRPSSSHLIVYKMEHWGNGGWMWGSVKQYVRYNWTQNIFSCPYFEMLVPKAMPLVVGVPPPPNPAPLVVVQDRVVYRDRVVAQGAVAVAPPFPTHIKELVKEFVAFGKEFECPCCMESIKADTLHITKCGHFYCEACIALVQPDYRGVIHCPSCRAVM